MFANHRKLWSAATVLVAAVCVTASASAKSLTASTHRGSVTSATLAPQVSGNDQRCFNVDGKNECFVTAFNDTIDCSAPLSTTWKNGFAETYVYGGWAGKAKMTIKWSMFGATSFTGGPSGTNYGTTSATWSSSVNSSGLVTLNYSGIKAFGYPLQASTTVTGHYTVHGHDYVYSVTGSKLC